MLYTASVTDHLKFQEKMTVTHVLCKIVVTQNIKDKIGTLCILKMSYRGCCMKEVSFSWSTKNSENDFFSRNLGRN